jgi:lipopolysaccharide biosynthesis protein/SAM-dependent methyltransferase
MKKEPENMEFTGERFVPEAKGNIELEHLHRYLQACQFASDKVVLDIASGEGYGSAMLAKKATKVIGVDISIEAINHARIRYKNGNLEFMVGSCADIPLPDKSVDLVVSFETIEHHDQHEKMMNEIKRVLRPNGILLISSPDKYHYSVEPKYSNPYHVKELYQHEFKELIGSHFKNVAYFGQRIIYGSGVFSESIPTSAISFFIENEAVRESHGIIKPIYWIALASDVELPHLVSGFLEQPVTDSEIVRACNKVIADRDSQLASLGHATTQLECQIAILTQALSEREGQIASLIQALSEREGQIANLTQALSEREGQIASLTQALSEREGQIASLTKSLSEHNKQTASLQLALVVQEKNAINERQRLTCEVTDQKETIEEILSSRSWRLTKPYRFLGKVMRPMVRAFRIRTYFLLRDLAVTLGMSQTLRSKLRLTLYGEALSSSVSGRNIIGEIPLQLIPQADLDDCESSSMRMGTSNGAIPVVEFDDTREEFCEYSENSKLNSIIKLIAFYLPQFHPFEENDTWWGKGFTEWTNVTKATPNFPKHYQPHLPIHFGFYDLRISEVMEEQARVAQNYGIYGFNYYFYWFAGKTLMETPLLKMLENPNIEMPFMLTWANENWTRRWDGADHEILIEQQHSDEDSLNFIRHIMKYFHDKRYIKIDGKPVLMVYRASLIPNLKKVAALWRREVEASGFPGLYLISAQSFGIQDPDSFEFDASAEFPPHTANAGSINDYIAPLDPTFRGKIFSYEQVVKNAVKKPALPYKCFRTIMLGWDNTPRKMLNSHIFLGFNLKLYKQWLSHLCHSVCSDEQFSRDEKIVFINAWNEWAEGTHLEPDRKYGFGYLSSTYAVVKNFSETRTPSHHLSKTVGRQQDYALILHLYYPDNLDEICSAIGEVAADKVDLYVTSSNPGILEDLKIRFPRGNFLFVENRGRDVLPFIEVYRLIHSLGYKAICKVHGKRSVYRADGDRIRQDLFNGLLGNASIFSRNLELFKRDNRVGLIGVPRYFIRHNTLNMTYNEENVDRAAKKTGISFRWDNFPAGSMFWFKPEALLPLLRVHASDFELEEGKADGTFAHAVERLISVIVKSQKFLVYDTDGNLVT